MRVNVLVDWGRAFVDSNGSFFCGTTEEQKDRAVLVSRQSDLTLYLSDVHSRNSSEFIANGGLYPTHNLILRDQVAASNLGVRADQTTNPQLTEKLYDIVKDKRSGLIVARSIYFQDFNSEENAQPAFALKDVEETFGVRRLNPSEFLDGSIEYVINAKHMFDGSGQQSYAWLGEVTGVPDVESNVFDLLKQKHGQGKDLEFDFTGVVMGICLYQSASGVRQIFPKAKVNIIADACTHLILEPLGIADQDTGNYVAQKMCKQVGIQYLSTAEYLGGRA